jgi:hypothetical protein
MKFIKYQLNALLATQHSFKTKTLKYLANSQSIKRAPLRELSGAGIIPAPLQFSVFSFCIKRVNQLKTQQYGLITI